MITFEIFQDRFALQETFIISRGSKDAAQVISLKLGDGEHIGRGECVPYARYKETPESVVEQLVAIAPDVKSGLTRDDLQTALLPGAARNALDCALWDLEAKQQGKRVWELAGLDEPEAVTTAFTLSLNTPDIMRVSAEKNAHRPLLKLKLGGEDDFERLEAVREGAPGADIIVDANEGWDASTWLALQEPLKHLGVSLIEQPLPANDDDALMNNDRLVPVCADESCHITSDLEKLAGRYDFVNIKLDKTGGLTEALKLRKEAIQLGFGIMTGCMIGSSLAMAPAILLAQGAEYTDLDGPLLLAEDRKEKLQYHGSIVFPAKPELWG